MGAQKDIAGQAAAALVPWRTGSRRIRGFASGIAVATALCLLPPTVAQAGATPGCELESALAHFRSGEHATAATAFESCIAAGVEQATARFHLGIMARDARRLEEARELLGQAASLAPENIPYRLEWAVTHEWLADLSAAANIYAGILAEEPGNLPASLGAARMAHWQGKLRRSLAGYRAILEQHPGHDGARSGLAFALLADNKPADARRLFEGLLADDPNNAQARQGLEMLAGLRTQRFESTSSVTRDASGQDIAQVRLAYTATPSYAIKWGAELVKRESFVTPPDLSGVPVNRSVKSSRALFLDYRFNATTSALASWRREELPAGKSQHKLQLEWMHKPSARHRVFAGMIPAFIDGDRVNLLSYAGYAYSPNADWSAMAQFYHGQDRDFASSRALSLSWSRNYGERNFLRLGASASETAGVRSGAVYASGVHYFSRAFAVRAGLVNDFSNDTREITLGVIYEF